ncbi:hypothetical protein [Vibrio crassostreae]|uniref:hypothetical protein n=1 Tax=Vibrio crassostreae TaxID=246167 RepID=UPI001B3118EC|nr:hypothetical protein [Vibrio crassostreae]
MKKMKQIAVLGTLLFAGAANAVTMSELTLDALQLIEYKEKEITPYDFSALANAGKEDFRDFSVVKTPEYVESMAYIDKQSYLTDYQKKAFDKLAFSVAYTVQHADQPEMLSRFKTTSNMIDFCGFYNLDQSTSFVVERMMTKGIADDQYLDRFKMGSKKILDFGHTEFEQRMPELIVHCGSFLGTDLKL